MGGVCRPSEGGVMLKRTLITLTLITLLFTSHVLGHEEYLGAPEMVTYDTMDSISLPIYYQVYLEEVSDRYCLHYEGLLAWMQLESSFNIRAIHYNDDGSYDFGLTQINSKYLEWYTSLARKYGLFEEDEVLIIDSPIHQIELGVAGLLYYREYWRSTGLGVDEIFIAMYNSYNMGIQGYLDYAVLNGTARRWYDERIINTMRLYELQRR